MPPEEDEKELDLRAQLEASFDASADGQDTDDQGTDDQGTDENAASNVSRETDGGQPRDEQGRWTKAQREQAARDAAAAAADPNAQKVDATGKPVDAEVGKPMPPPGWSPAAKAEFAKLPVHVQQAVAKREMEINAGFQKLQDYKGMEPYVELARANGTTLPEAFERYHAAETALEKNFPQGVAALCEMFGVHPMQLATHFAQQYATSRRQPDGRVVPQQDPSRDPMGLIMRRLDGIEQKFSTLTSREEQAADAEIRSEIEAFKADNIYFEDVKADMAALIREGRATSLQQAYDKACRMNDEIYDLIIKDRGAPSDNARRMDQHRRAAGSLPAGSPLPNARGDAGDPKASIRADLERNWNASAI